MEATTIRLELTEEQVQQLVDLIDIATKAGGLPVAKVSVPLVDAIMASVRASQKAEE